MVRLDVGGADSVVSDWAGFVSTSVGLVWCKARTPLDATGAQAVLFALFLSELCI